MKHCLNIFISVALLSPVITGYSTGASQDLFKGRLFQSFFYSYIPDYSAAKIGTASLPQDVQGRVEEYKRRNHRFRSLAKSCKSLRGIELAYCDKKLAVEKAIVSLINKKGIERIAVKYARAAVLFYEWEGLAGGPLDEAKYAEEYLNKYPATVLEPYLLLFLVHRYRCAYECLELEKKFEEQKESAAKYKYYLQKAQEHPDKLVGLIATDIDLQPYLYIGTKHHP